MFCEKTTRDMFIIFFILFKLGYCFSQMDLLPHILHENYGMTQEPNQPELYGTFGWSESDQPLLLLVPGAHSTFATWSRRVTKKYGFNVGTMLPYVYKGVECGYDVLITQPLKYDSMYLHNILRYIQQKSDKKVNIIAHSFGGQCVINVLDSFQTMFGSIHLLDSVNGLEPEHLQKPLSSIINWAESEAPLGTLLYDNDSYMIWKSAGHDIHEYTPYTAHGAVFKYLCK